MNRYEVKWETSIGMGATFYQGKETLCADSDEAAEAIAQFNVWRRAFRDWPKSHVIVTSVKEVK